MNICSLPLGCLNGIVFGIFLFVLVQAPLKYRKLMNYIRKQENWTKTKGLIIKRYGEDSKKPKIFYTYDEILGKRGPFDRDDYPCTYFKQYLSYRVLLPFVGDIHGTNLTKSSMKSRKICVDIDEITIDSLCAYDEKYVSKDKEITMSYNYKTQDPVYRQLCKLKENDTIDIEYCKNPFYFNSIKKWHKIGIIDMNQVFDKLWNDIENENDSKMNEKANNVEYLKDIVYPWRLFDETTLNIIPNTRQLAIGQYLIRLKNENIDNKIEIDHIFCLTLMYLVKVAILWAIFRLMIFKYIENYCDSVEYLQYYGVVIATMIFVWIFFEFAELQVSIFLSKLCGLIACDICGGFMGCARSIGVRQCKADDNVQFETYMKYDV